MILRRLVSCAAIAVFVGLVNPPAASPKTTADTTSAADFYREALVKFHQGDYRAAIVLLKNTLRIEARNIEARTLAGRSYLRIGDGRSAERQLNRARALGADDLQTLLPLSRAYFFSRQIPGNPL